MKTKNLIIEIDTNDVLEVSRLLNRWLARTALKNALHGGVLRGSDGDVVGRVRVMGDLPELGEDGACPECGEVGRIYDLEDVEQLRGPITVTTDGALECPTEARVIDESAKNERLWCEACDTDIAVDPDRRWVWT